VTVPPADPELATVRNAVDRLLADLDPRITDFATFRGARFDRGLAWVHLAPGFGGLGVRPELNRFVEVRLRENGAAPADATMFFSSLAGPTIATWGTDEQRQRFLRPMFTGQERWCQLFSEPGAGSDLAGLACRAERDGHEWVVNGQKVWNTLAHLGDWGMLVTRTDPSVAKHKGMTYFALDMRLPGVEVRPLRQITGEAEFNEVFLTDVRIPDTCRIGPIGDGWRVALTTLMNERSAIGDLDAPGLPPGGAAAPAVKVWQSLDPAQRSAVRRGELLRLWTRGEVQRLTSIRAAEEAQTGNPGPSASVGKLVGAELNQDVRSFCLDLLGLAGLVGLDYTFRRTEPWDTSVPTPGHQFLRSRANSIEGGTSEILRNVLGEQVLGLPGEPRVDKDVPWSSISRRSAR
jgi:alkylation response protein AidB-like acyl-CoA dehydrogenase